MLICQSPLLTLYFFFVWAFKKLTTSPAMCATVRTVRNALAVIVPLSNISLYLGIKMVV